MTFLQKIPAWAYFWIFIISLAFFYNYPSILFKKPQSVHHWRQSDCASLALMYYQNGMKFFEPQTHNLTSDHGTTGFVAPSELPLFYYFIAILYKIFGYHDYIFRICNTLIFMLGLFYLFRLFRLVSQSIFWGIASAVLFFTSPVLAYYGNNFLSNSSALSFSIVGVYYFALFYIQKNNKHFYLSQLFFCLACCMKISAGFAFFSILALFLAEKISIPISPKRVFPRGILPWLGFITALAIPLSWIFYAHLYNLRHTTDYFSTGTFPIWTLDPDFIRHIKDNVWNMWRREYFSDAVLIFFSGLLVLQCFYLFRNKRIWSLTLLLLLGEAMVYILLQFMTFADHDYYTMDMYIILIFWLINSFIIIKQFKQKLLSNKLLKSIFVLFLIYNGWYCHDRMRIRYEGWWNEYPVYQDFHFIKPYLRSLGIQPLDKIITLPEYSYSLLYLTNQRGWSDYTDSSNPHTDQAHFRKDSTRIASLIRHGAKYMLVLDTATTFKNLPAFRSLAKYPIGNFYHITLFAIKQSDIPKIRPEQKVQTIVKFDAENNNPKIIKGCAHGIIMENMGIRTSSKSYSGQQSVQTSSASPFGFTTIIQDVHPFDVFEVSVKYQGEHGFLIASSLHVKPFYCKSNESKSTGREGWNSLNIEFYIPMTLPQSKLKIYVWGNGNNPVYFDDLRITRKEGFPTPDIL